MSTGRNLIVMSVFVAVGVALVLPLQARTARADVVTIDLESGWNFFSYLGIDGLSVEEALGQVAGKYMVVGHYFDGKFLTFEAGVPDALNTLHELERYEAYVVFMTSPGQMTFPISEPPDTVCPADPASPGVRLQAGADYYATGSDDPQHDFKGVEAVLPVLIPNAPPSLSPTYAVSLWHSHDWVIYHFSTRNAPLEVISLCLRNLTAPSSGTMVDVMLFNPTATVPVVPPHDADISIWPGWTVVGPLIIVPPGNWTVYRVNTVGIPPSPHYFIAVRLQDGETGPQPGNDRNVDIAWCRLLIRRLTRRRAFV